MSEDRKVERIGWAVRAPDGSWIDGHWDRVDTMPEALNLQAARERAMGTVGGVLHEVYAAPEGHIEALGARELTDEDREALRLLASTAVWISDEVDEDPEVRAKMDRAVEILSDRFGVEYITAREPGMALVEEPAFVRSTILAAIDEMRGEWNPELSDDPDEEAYLSGGDQALTNLRARFQPTEGDQDG